MHAAVRPLATLTPARMSRRRQLTGDTTTRGKVAVVAAADRDVIRDDTGQSADVEDTSERGFCGEPFADDGELLASVSPLLSSMKLFGLYFLHRRDRRADDAHCGNTARSSSTGLRAYATVMISRGIGREINSAERLIQDLHILCRSGR